MRKPPQKIKVPSLKLPHAVIKRVWQSDEHQTLPRLCSYDTCLATFAESADAEAYCKSQKREFYNVEICKISTANLASVRK